MNEHCSILPTIGIVVFNILCFTALHYTAYKHALLQCPGLHQPILHNRVGQLAKCQRHLSTFSSYSKPVHWLYYSWKTQDVSYLHKMSHTYTRCLIPTHVQLMKLKQDAISELGRQLHKKSLFIYW